MLLNELGYNAISPLTETSIISENTIIVLKARFKKIVSIFDNDNTGNKASNHYFDKYAIPYIKVQGEKDISDYCKINGIKKTKQFLKNLI
jgi:DNA primase